MKQKLIITNGCSFTWGDELSNREQEAYPYIIGKKFNCSVRNLAENAQSNEAIVRTTIEYLMTHDLSDYDPVLIIGWSGISRKEIWTGSEWHKITATGMGHDPYAKAHFKYLQSEKQDNLEFFNHVLLMQLLLEKLKINYFFFRIDDGQTLQTLKDGSNKSVTDGFNMGHMPLSSYFDLINLDKFPCYTNNDLTFKTYILNNGGELKPGKHPDEKSHKIFADYIISKIS
jgi:hypothetical protein